MRGAAALILRSLRRSAALVLTLGSILAAFQVVLALAGSALHSSGLFGQVAAILPPVVRTLIGPALASVLSYAGVAAIGYFHVAVTAAVVALAVALGTEPAAEIESGFADLILARPVRREVVVARSAVVVTFGVTVVVAMMAAGTWFGSAWIAPSQAARPSARLILSLAGNLWALAVCWGGLALAVASRSRRRSTAGAVTALAALALFLLDYLGRLWQPAARLARLSPFRYCSGLELVAGRPLAVAHLAVLLSVALAGFVVAVIVFARRDI